MDLRSFVSTSNDALSAATNFFSLPSGASTKEIRLNGLKCVGMGLFCFALCLVPMLFLSADAAIKAMFLPSLLGYSFILVGGYRLVFGKAGAQDPYDAFSFVRILFGVAWVASIFGIPLFLLAYFSSPPNAF